MPESVYDAMSHEARELTLYCENEEWLYKMQEQIDRNMARKYVKGVFDLDLAIKGYRHLVDSAAKQYTLEHGSMTDKWSNLFPVSDRNRVAEYFARSFVNDLYGYLRRSSEDLQEAPRAVVDKALAAGWQPDFQVGG